MVDLLKLPVLERAFVIRRNFPKTCGNCGARYTFKQWQSLPNPRPWRFPWGEEQELRECVCGSTLAILVVEGEPET